MGPLGGEHVGVGQDGGADVVEAAIDDIDAALEDVLVDELEHSEEEMRRASHVPASGVVSPTDFLKKHGPPLE